MNVSVKDELFIDRKKSIWPFYSFSFDRLKNVSKDDLIMDNFGYLENLVLVCNEDQCNNVISTLKFKIKRHNSTADEIIFQGLT